MCNPVMVIIQNSRGCATQLWSLYKIVGENGMKKPATTKKIKIGIDSSKSPINEIKKPKHITLSKQFQDSMGKMVDFKTFKRKIKETFLQYQQKIRKRTKLSTIKSFWETNCQQSSPSGKQIVNNQVLLGNKLSTIKSFWETIYLMVHFIQ